MPFGFDTEDTQTATGNLLGHGALQLARCAATERCVLERSWTSLMQHLPARQALSELESAEEVRSDSCQFD